MPSSLQTHFARDADGYGDDAESGDDSSSSSFDLTCFALRKMTSSSEVHMHCTCSFYRPLVPPNTGVLAYLKPSRHSSGFRIPLTGLTIEVLSRS
jgi:hypothetical protein